MRRAVLFIAVVVVVAACQQSSRETAQGSTPTQSTTATGNTQAVPENSTAMNAVAPPSTSAAGQRVPAAAEPSINVNLTEYTIAMPESVPAGRRRFHVENAGKENHNFVIEGNGIAEKMANDLTRGDSGEIVVDLKPGTYTIYCPVDGHRGKGMSRTLTVSAAP